MAQTQQESIVTEHFDNYASTWHDRINQHSYNIRFEATKKLIANLNPKRVIDIGCGTGDYA